MTVPSAPSPLETLARDLLDISYDIRFVLERELALRQMGIREISTDVRDADLRNLWRGNR